MIRIIEATPLEGYRLKVRFNDGVEGIYSVEPERRGGVQRRARESRFRLRSNGPAAWTFAPPQCTKKCLLVLKLRRRDEAPPHFPGETCQPHEYDARRAGRFVRARSF